MDVDNRISSLFHLIEKALTPDFSGLGLVFYTSLLELPHLALDTPSYGSMVARVVGEGLVAETLARVSSYQSPWHDGFHFVRVSDFSLTHIAQYVSPKIPSGLSVLSIRGGARHVSAALSSMSPGITLTAVLPAQGNGVVYKGGQGKLIERRT